MLGPMLHECLWTFQHLVPVDELGRINNVLNRILKKIL